ncbi:unnamed protein product, partial [Staurois parvus]
FSPKCAITSSSFLSSGGTVNFTSLSTENQNLNCLLSQKTTTSRSSVLDNAAGDHSLCVNHQLDISNLSNSAKHTVTSVTSVSSGVALSLKPSFTPKTETLSLSPESLLLPSINLQCDKQNIENTLAHSALPPSSSSNLQSTQGLRQEISEDFESQEDELPEDDISFATENCLSQPSVQEKPQTVEEVSEALKSQKSETLLKQKKMALISAVCCSLVNSPAFSDPSDLTRTEIQTLCEDVARLDPEFVLKVALYTRQELNIRSTANFLLAVSAFLPACRPHLRRYFCPSVQLPSDWMEVPRLYQSLAGKGDNLAALPHCLRRALTLKFKEFSEYQLAKYNTRVQRGKHGTKKKRERESKVSKPLRFGRKLRAIESSLKLLQEQRDQANSASNEKKKKKKDKFSLKSLIQRLHISQPAYYHVMSLLGCRYPKDLTAFSRSGLEGPWQSHLSEQRMKLKQPETWERELSKKGNTGPVWESLLDNHKVPFMALLRNLRNMIRAGISKKHHRAVNARLTNQHAVIQSRLFPFRFLSAYKVIQDLECQVQKAGDPLPSNAVLLQRIFRREGKNIPMLARNRFGRRELRASL